MLLNFLKPFWGWALLGTVAAVLPAGAALTDAGPPEPLSGLSHYHKAVLAAKPSGYWRLGEPKGSHKAADASGHHRDGTYEGKPHLGQPSLIPGDPNTSITLDGPKSKSYVEIPAHKAFSVATSGKGLTVEVWMRPDALDFEPENKDAKNPYIHWLGKGEKGAFEWGFRFYNIHAERKNRISAYIWNPDGGEGSGAYFEDKLTKHEKLYVVATFDDPDKANARVQIYKNGKPSTHNGSTGNLYKTFAIKPVSGKAPVRLGTRDLHGFLTGGLDEVAIYPRVLSAEEIHQHWLAAMEIKK